VEKNGSLVYLGRLPTVTDSSIWRDIKVIGNTAFIVSEAPSHGLQVFDLTRLLPISPSKPITFDVPGDLLVHLTSFGNAHNVVANQDTDMIYIVGTGSMAHGKCNRGLWMLDVSDPAQPKDLGCGYDEGYVHDAQCVVYHGPDARYNGHEICFTYAEDHFGVIDVTDKAKPVVLSKTSYEGVHYTHQGWLATQDMTHVLLDDEIDEMVEEITGGLAHDGHTLTRVINIEDLRHPVFTSLYHSSVIASDHNQYVNGTLAFQSNYGAGLRILDISAIKQTQIGKAAPFEEVGYFDCYPDDDEFGGITSMSVGAWSAYPYFASGNVLLNCIERGMFSLRYTGKIGK
jgi:choice-of-anchor B domain-containing protein